MRCARWSEAWKRAEQVFGEDISMVRADVTEPSTLPPSSQAPIFVISALGASGKEKGKASPEAVDYRGSVALIDAARSAGVKKFVMVSSGGVTWWTHPLNWFYGGVLKWKRKAEVYLRHSGLTHVIVRPNGGLSDDSRQCEQDRFYPKGWLPLEQDFARGCGNRLC